MNYASLGIQWDLMEGRLSPQENAEKRSQAFMPRAVSELHNMYFVTIYTFCLILLGIE
jgi:hypothetical protein